MIPKLAVTAFVIVCFLAMGYVGFTSATAFIENERSEAFHAGKLEGWEECRNHFQEQIDDLREKARGVEFMVDETNQFMRHLYWEMMVKQLQDTTYAEVNDDNRP